jgi:glycolate oxidase FAD binding subunit
VSVVTPSSEAELAQFVREAAGRKMPLSIVGGGTKRTFGRPTQVAGTISTAGLAGITLYEPAEMVIAARAGTPLSEVIAALDARGQMLPFEPCDWRHLLGSEGEPTIGSVVAMNLSGPRRIMAGAARDSLIGTRFVNGLGEVVQSGGRVMKNVTGLDLARLMAGAHGTLGVLTEVTFRVLPKPEMAVTLVFAGLDDVSAVKALSAALGSPFSVSGAAHLPAGIGGDGARTLVRLEGFATSVDYRAGRLSDLLRPLAGAPSARLDTAASGALWRAVADVAFLAEPREPAVWRVSVAPDAGPRLVAALRGRIACSALYDWGGGLVWLACDAGGDAGAREVRAALREVVGRDGHATLIRAPEPVRAAVEVFEPQPDAVMKLTRGLKASFDPAGLFEPGRIHAGV